MVDNQIEARNAAKPACRIVESTLQNMAVCLFQKLHEMSFDGVGISRETYGSGETDAMKLIESSAIVHGFERTWDPAQNLIIRMPGLRPDLPVVATGSHLDSVPQGGNFDGAAGVISSFISLLAAKDRPPLRTIEVYILRGEESAWYGGPCYFGSRALFGQLTDVDFESVHRLSGETLEDNMKRSGVDVPLLKNQTRLCDPERIFAWLELHIEQGPVLVAKEKPVGLVTGIRGNVRHRRVVCKGKAAHSGAVPRWLRNDAVLAMAQLLMRLDEHWRVLLEWGEDLVLTSGIVQTNSEEHAVSRVPGEISFALEYRSQHVKTLESFGTLIQAECAKIEAERGVTFELGEPVYTEPATMSERLVALASEAANEVSVPFEIMPSGAGHDSAVFANNGVPSAMLFVRNENGSHNPAEAMDYKDFFCAAEVLSRTIIRLANMSEETVL